MNDYNRQHAFLGTGLHFPVTVNEVTGRIQESAHEENIRESIYLIIMTRKGERVMRPDFGCDIYQYMFDMVDYTTLNRMKCAVEEALLRWEPRITDVKVKVIDMIQERNAVQIEISYKVRTTNSPYNLVFPFYMEET